MGNGEKNILLHALGHVGYRNYFVADEGHTSWEILEGLVAKGYMRKRLGAPESQWAVFHVTNQGQKEVGVYYSPN